MRIGIRNAISALVLTSIVVSAVGVHLLWWRTAHQVSQTLADTINDQIVSAVGDELQSITTEARSALHSVAGSRMAAVHVETSDGRVTLFGKVRSQHDKASAAADVGSDWSKKSREVLQAYGNGVFVFCHLD